MVESPGERGGRERRFVRPWEDPDTAEQEALEAEDTAEDAADTADEDWWRGRARSDDPLDEHDDESSVGLFSQDDYVAATTEEYRGLAEEVARADSEEFERQAVAASIPGVGSGLIGFEDVTGRKGISEEEVEAEEQARASDLTLRVGTAVVLLGLFLGSLLLGGVWFSGFVAVVMLLSLGEFYATVRTRGYAPPAIFGLLAAVAIAVGAHGIGPSAIVSWVVVTLVAVSFFYAVTGRRNPLENVGVTVLGLAWVALLAFAIVIGRSERAVGMILLVVFVTAMFDIGSYFVGRAFGRRQLAPRVSPRKTVEGLLGGVITAFAVTLILSTIPLFDPLDFRGSLALALLVSLLAPLGDAAESVVKRGLDVKDMGSLLPGHGGMLDRIDALLFVVPAAYFLFQGLGYL